VDAPDHHSLALAATQSPAGAFLPSPTDATMKAEALGRFLRE
jgi:hypothetical protein